LYRLRLSSIEPQTVTDELLGLLASSPGRLCRYLHIPMQSGSSRILRLMHRPYDRAAFMERLRAVKEAGADTVIGADVIVGFPGETAEDFADSKSLAESGLIDYLHVFSYSDRPGTPAASLPDKVPHETVRERNHILTAVSNDIRYRSHRQQVGRVLEVIAEYRQAVEGHGWGISDNYIRVRLPVELDSGRTIVRIRVTAAYPEFVEGEIVS
jgi:threonylcarbamoyladenosine tRNA methylthiotransferase MtaB